MTAEELKAVLFSVEPQFEGKNLPGDTKFVSILDSIDMLEFEWALQDKLGVDLPEDFFDDTETVDQLVIKLLNFLQPKEVIDNGVQEIRQGREEKIDSSGEPV